MSQGETILLGAKSEIDNLFNAWTGDVAALEDATSAEVALAVTEPVKLAGSFHVLNVVKGSETYQSDLTSAMPLESRVNSRSESAVTELSTFPLGFLIKQKWK